MTISKKRRRYIRYLPLVGCVSTGAIYVSVGVIALLALFSIREGGADENSLLAFLSNYMAGVVLVWIILVGMVSYIAWRIFEAFRDPYNYGSDMTGIGRRAGIGLSSIADALIAYSAIAVLVGASNYSEDGEPTEQREMVGSMLRQDWGEWLIIGLGLVVIVTAVVQFTYGVTRGYKERVDIAHFNNTKKSIIHFLAWVGYFSRGFILGIIGFFFIKAGFLEEERHVVNTDKAFNFIGENVGNIPFALVAVGTICYGFFMFAMGITYDVDNDPSRKTPEKEASAN